MSVLFSLIPRAPSGPSSEGPVGSGPSFSNPVKEVSKMNAILRAITLALSALVFMGITNNPVHAAGEEFTCDPTRVAVYNFIDCGKCGSCPPEGMDRMARNEADKNTTGITKLSESLARANGALARLRTAKADASVVVALELRIQELERRGSNLCGGLKETAHVTLCLETLRAGSLGMQENILSLLTEAYKANVPHEILLVQGDGPLGPGFLLRSNTPKDTTPAFANVRRDRQSDANVEPASPPWVYVAVPLATGAAGALIGYGYGDQASVSQDAWSEGNQGQTTAIGFGFGLLVGLATDGIIAVMSD